MSIDIPNHPHKEDSEEDMSGDDSQEKDDGENSRENEQGQRCGVPTHWPQVCSFLSHLHHLLIPPPFQVPCDISKRSQQL